MNAVNHILVKSLAKEFYRENAGTFVFFFVLLFGVVGILHYATFWTYHYSLILGMLMNPGIFCFILILWFWYARKGAAFIAGKMKQPGYEFLYTLNALDKSQRVNAFMMLQCMLYCPVLLYSLAIVGVALYHYLVFSAMVIIVFHLVIVFSGSRLYVHLLGNPEKKYTLLPKGFSLPVLHRNRQGILFAYLLNDLKILASGIKIFTCGILFLLAKNNIDGYYDLQVPFSFFSFGLFANGIIIHRLRRFEEVNLSFYRTLPLPLLRRFMQNAILCLACFIPELITLYLLTPEHVHFNDAIHFAVSGYGIILLINSITYIAHFEMKAYLRILLLLYFILYLFIAEKSFMLLGVLLLLASALLFLKRYYRYEFSD